MASNPRGFVTSLCSEESEASDGSAGGHSYAHWSIVSKIEGGECKTWDVVSTAEKTHIEACASNKVSTNHAAFVSVN